MLLKFAPLLLRSPRRALATRQTDRVAEMFEPRSVLSASAMSATTECVADLSNSNIFGTEAVGPDVESTDFDSNDFATEDFALVSDHREPWCFAESDWIEPDSVSSEGMNADVLEYSITTEGDVELYSAEIVAINGDVDEIATDDFVFELDDYLMNRFSGGEDFALADGIVEFYVVDVSSLSDMNGDAMVDGADYVAAAGEFGLTGYDSAYDFLVVRSDSGFDVVDIPYDVNVYDSGIGIDLDAVDSIGSLTDGVSEDSLGGGTVADSVSGSSGIEFFGDNDTIFADATSDEAIRSDSLSTGASSDAVEIVLTADSETLGLHTDAVFDSSLTSFSEQFTAAFGDVPSFSDLFKARVSSLESSDGLQLASASDPHQSSEMAALIASLVRDQQADSTLRTSFETKSQVRPEVAEADNFGWLTSTISNIPHQAVPSTAEAYSFASPTTDIVSLKFIDEREDASLSTSREADVVFSHGAAKLFSRLEGDLADTDRSAAESLSYSQMASATGVLLIAGSGCVQLSRRNGWWLLWRAVRRSVLTALRLV